MWWIIITLLLILPLAVEAAATTVFVIIMLNGYPSLPDDMVLLYGIATISLVPGLSLGAGFLAKSLSDFFPIPLWLTGSVTGLVTLLAYPVILIALTFALLAAFGML
jgi:hypothetical protein